VLVVRLTKNQPLPDGNERAAWVALRVFVEVNRWKWVDYPSVDEAEQDDDRHCLGGAR
jgi:prophage maintenance system killer protein